jgi:hypothetical protein
MQVVDTMNLTFGTSEISTRYWTQHIYAQLQAKFKGVDLRGNMDATYCCATLEDFKQLVAQLVALVQATLDWRWVILRRWQAMESFQFSPVAEQELPRNINRRFESERVCLSIG